MLICGTSVKFRDTGKKHIIRIKDACTSSLGFAFRSLFYLFIHFDIAMNDGSKNYSLKECKKVEWGHVIAQIILKYITKVQVNDVCEIKQFVWKEMKGAQLFISQLEVLVLDAVL